MWWEGGRERGRGVWNNWEGNNVNSMVFEKEWKEWIVEMRIEMATRKQWVCYAKKV